MAYKSKAQQRYLWAAKPELAKEFGKGQSTKAIKALPDHVKKPKAKKASSKKK